tara:strand:- start:995 stop:1225 length:231 start_codon:yes stop_codon:yes gene_type:complete
MNTLTQQFNDQANWNILFWSLFALMVLNDIERGEKRRRAFVSKLQRGFNETSKAQSQEQYQRQVASQPRPMPVPRL